ncbi:MAG: cell division protein [Actinophytocola sp.]|nr:cell division protein [Actinophytocola sp.]
MQQEQRATDPWIYAAAAFLGALGMLNMLSLGMSSLAIRHGAFLLGGFCLMLLLARLRFRDLSTTGWTVYGIAITMLLAVPLVGVTVNGAQRWLDLGFMTVQPAELAKLAVVLVLANLLARGYSLGRFLLGLLVAALPVVLVAVQPNLSTAIVLAAVAGMMLVLARVPLLPLLPLFGLVIAALPLAVIILRPYQLGRVHAFLSGARDAEGPGWAALQAEIAVGEGGLFGMAREPLYNLRASYLPESEHDLAFASLVHGWGLVAGVVAVAAILVLVWRCALASRLARGRDAALISVGVAALFGIHAAVSIAVNLTLVPHTGLPIPLLSYGGTTAVVHLAALGLVLAARRDGIHRPLWAPPQQRKQHPRWARVGAVALSMNLVAMSLVAWHVQDARGDELRVIGEHQMTRCIRLPAERGGIVDRHGTPLVATAKSYQAHVVPGLFPGDDPASIARLAKLLEVPKKKLVKALKEPTEELSVPLSKVSSSAAHRVAEAELPGVLVMPTQRRKYPHGALLGPLLGFTAIASEEDMARWPSLALGSTVGKTGLERQYDAVLRGIDGKQCVYVDPEGRPVAAAERVDPVAGHQLQLSLDLPLQRAASKALRKAVRDSPGDLGAEVVMDARTGAVLAMASVPAYDNNDYGPPADLDAMKRDSKAPGLPLFNHATQVAGPPGSTFKIVVASANSVYRAISPTQVVPTGGAYTYGGHTFNNWQAMGPHNLMQAIQRSDNVYFYKLAIRLGADKIAKTARRLGVGQPTGIDLPGEAAGYLGTPKSVEADGGVWYPGSTVLMGIGQGAVTATPLQLARWTNGIATGRMVTPQLAASYGGKKPNLLATPKPRKLKFGGKLEAVRDGMRLSATEGTGGQLAQLDISALSKTGTAQDPSSPNGGTHAWFSAVVPADKPEIVVTSFVRSGGYGSAVSGPVVISTLKHWLKHR